MQFPDCGKSNTRTSSGIFLKKMPPLTLLARASESEELH
jgi:hypothetical protein